MGPAGETWAEYKTATPPEEVVLAPPAAPSSLLTQVPDQKESFQETDEQGSSLEGGGIAGIVIGVLIGLVALGVGWVYKRSQQKRIPMKEYLKDSLSTSRTTSRVELNEGSTNDIEKIKAKYRRKADPVGEGLNASRRPRSAHAHRSGHAHRSEDSLRTRGNNYATSLSLSLVVARVLTCTCTRVRQRFDR